MTLSREPRDQYPPKPIAPENIVFCPHRRDGVCWLCRQVAGESARVLRGTQPKRREDSRLNTILIVAVLMAGELFVAWCWFR